MLIIDAHNTLGTSNATGASLDEAALQDVCEAAGISMALCAAADDADVVRSYEGANEALSLASRRDPRIACLFRIYPADARNARLQVERAASLPEVVGLKLAPAQDNFGPEELLDLLEVVGESALPLALSAGHEPGCHPVAWLDTFESFPDVPVVLNGGGRDRFEEAARMATTYPQVRLGTSLLSLYQLQSLYDLVGPRKLVYESSMPHSHPAIEVRKINLAITDPEDRAMVFHQNAREVFGLQ